MKHTCLSNLLMASTVLWTFSSVAQTVGKVFLLKGDAVTFTEVLPKENKVIQNGPVSQKDILRTEANSNLEIGFLDATSCKLGPSTELAIEEYLFVRGQQTSTFKATLKNGKATFTTGKMVTDNPEKFKITTPSATIGVRGCLFDLEQKGPDRLVINVMEVGKTNEPSVIVTTPTGKRYEFKAPGHIVIEKNKIVEIGPVIVQRPPLGVLPEFKIPLSDVIQQDNPLHMPHTTRGPIDNQITPPPFGP